jgi:hypothetical protein
MDNRAADDLVIAGAGRRARCRWVRGGLGDLLRLRLGEGGRERESKGKGGGWYNHHAHVEILCF